MSSRKTDSIEAPTLLQELDRLRTRVIDLDRRYSRVRDLEKQLYTAERRFLSLLDSIRMFAVGLDQDGRIIYANNFFLEIVGSALHEIQGNDWLEVFVPASHRELIAPLLQELLQTGVTPRFEHPILTRSRGQRLVAWSGGWLMQDAKGPPVRISLGADVTEQRRAEAELRVSEARYRAIVEDQTELVCRLNGEGRLTFVNEATCHYFDRDREQILERSFFDIFVDDQGERAKKLLATLSESRPVDTIELQCSRSSGENRWLQWTCRMLETTVAEEREYQVVGRDETERRNAEEEMTRATRELQLSFEQQKRLSQELDKARERAEEAATAKSRFLAHMSHEIRTPMNGVIGGIHLVLDSDLSPQQRETVEIIHSSAESLLSLINEILDFSKIEAGKLELDRSPVNVRAMVEDVTAMLGPQVYEKGLELVSLIQADVPSELEGDPTRLRQILTNLVGNAAKFTEQGEIVIRVTLISSLTDSVRLRFEVHDTGIGISEEKCERLFQSFSQIDPSTTRHFGGTGLGLAISKALVEKMAGEIGVESEPGSGSKFWFTVELATADQPGSRSLADVLASLKDRRVLVADAHEPSRQAVMIRLAADGCHCKEVSSGNRALTVLRQSERRKRPFDLVIVGSKMDDMSGEELGAEIRKTFDQAALPLVMLTPCGLRGDSARLEKIGFNAFLTKPIRGPQLLRRLREVLELTGVEDAPAPERILTRFSLGAENELGFAILLAEDIVINQKVAVRILERLGHRVDVAANGEEAVEAASSGRYDLILMDCEMPVMDGFQATEAIRVIDGPAADLPIIALTANAIKGDRERCLAVGMNDYLTKPLSPKALAKAIQQAMKNRSMAPA